MAVHARVPTRHRLRTPCLALAVATCVAGCSVGPNFQPPAAPAAAASAVAYTPTPIPAETASAPGLAGGSQHLALGRDIPAQWWQLFRSDSLDQLIRAALAQSPNLAAAQAALRNSQETLAAQTGALQYPAVSGQFAAERERSTSLTGPGLATYNLYNASINVTYAVDVFGANRRTLEGLAAQVDYQRYQVEAAYLTLVSNVVTTAIREASLRAQVQATLDVLALQEKQLGVVDAQFNAGAISKSAVLQQRTQVAQTRATLPGLEKSLGQTRHQLSVLVGQLPSEPGIPEFQLTSLQLPDELPVTLPSELVRQRPDIRASEALLHQASAQVGVAVANQYPQINLSGSLGSGATRIGDLFGSGTGLWNIAGSLTQPIFNGGALSARKRAAEAAYDQAEANYRSIVLGAFQNVADALRAIDSDAAALRTQAEAEALARDTLDLSNRQYQLGAISYLALLDVQRIYQQTRIALVQAQATRYADTAALFQALGGGWWNQPS